MSGIKRSFKKLLSNIRFQLSAQNSPLFIGFYRYFYRPKPNSLSQFLDQYSKKTGAGFTVIQVGANDGITHDPIHKFIKRDEWQGVLLEPLKEVFEHKLSKIYRRNVGIHTLNAALSHSDGSRPIYKIGFSNARWATGLSSFNKEVVEKAFSTGLVAQKAAKQGITIPETADKRIVEEQVKEISVTSLIDQYQLKKVDLLQIDAEGFDYEVIKYFKGHLDNISCIIFENQHLMEMELKECNQLLKECGYSIREYGKDTVAIKE